MSTVTIIKQLIAHPMMPEMGILMVMGRHQIINKQPGYLHEQVFHTVDEIGVNEWKLAVEMLDAAAEDGVADINDVGVRRQQGVVRVYCIVDTMFRDEYLADNPGSTISIQMPDQPFSFG